MSTQGHFPFHAMEKIIRVPKFSASNVEDSLKVNLAVTVENFNPPHHSFDIVSVNADSKYVACR